MLEIVLTPKILGPPEIGALGLSLFSLVVNPPLQQAHNRLWEKANENVANQRKHN